MPAARRRVVAALIVTTVLLLGVGGCGRDRSVRPAGPTPDAFELSGRDGMLRLHLPPVGTPEPYPLVVALHSLFHDGGDAQRLFGLDPLADRAGFAVVYPDGLEGSWNAGTCCGYAAMHDVDDVAYLWALISHIERGLPIDRRRVVLVGDSNGGMLAYRYACEHAEEIAGVGVVSASLMISGCRPAVPLTVVAVHGLRDRTVPPTGARFSAFLQAAVPSLSASLAPFRRAAGCTAATRTPPAVAASPSASPSASASPARAPAASASARAGAPGASTSPRPSGGPRLVETSCGSGVRVVEWLLPADGHGWPPRQGGWDAAAAVWQVLSSARSVEPGPDL